MIRRVLFAVSAAALACADAPVADTGPLPEWTVASEPAVTIGGNDSRPEYQLYLAGAATRLSDGRIVVLNAGSAELRFFSPDGVFVRAVGGAGDGPGELRFPMAMRRGSGDTLLVLSRGQGVSWFDPNGEYVRASSVDLSSAGTTCRIAESNVYLMPDASVVRIFEDTFGISGCPPTPPSPWRQSGMITRQLPGVGGLDTLAVLPATERNSPNYRVYGRSLLLGLGADRIYAGDTGSESILSLDVQGDTVAALPTPFGAEPIPDRAKAVEVREFTRPDGSVERGSAYLYPDEYPRFARLLVSELGNVWVMAYPEVEEPTSSYRFAIAFRAIVPDSVRWRVLSPLGEPLAEVRTPAGFLALEVGEDYILGVAKDELDVETVQLYGLQR